MHPQDPTISRKIFEIESGIRQAPEATLDQLEKLDLEGLPRTATAKIRLLRVRLLMHFERFNEARAFLHETRRMINSKSDEELSAYSQILLGRLKNQACDPLGALQLIESSLPVLLQEPLEPPTAAFLCESLIVAANCAADQAMYSRAIGFLQHSAELARRFDLSATDSLNVLARIYLHLRQYQSAKRIAILAIDTDPSETGFTYSHLLLARAHCLSGELQECLDTCSSGFVSVSHRSIESKLKLIVAETFLRMGEAPVAKGYHREALEHAKAAESDRDFVKAKTCESLLNKSEGDLGGALKSIEEVRGNPAAVNLIHLRHELLREEAQLQSQLGNYQESVRLYGALLELGFESLQLEEQAKMQEYDLDSMLARLGVSLQNTDASFANPNGPYLTRNAQDLLNKLSELLNTSEDSPALSGELNRLGSELQNLIHQAALEPEFDQVLEKTFKSNLLSINPTLTSTELKICSLVRDDLSSIQIAYKLDISVRTVDAHRAKIRKKLGLDNSHNLRSFLIKV